MISRFFIDRPIFATVLSVVITLLGGIALYSLPVAQYCVPGMQMPFIPYGALSQMRPSGARMSFPRPYPFLNRSPLRHPASALPP